MSDRLTVDDKKKWNSKARESSFWIFISFGGAQGLRFLSNLILTRLLFQEAFGIMTIVNTIIVGLTLFSDLGIGPSLIQNKRGKEPAFYNTAWTIQIIRGWGIFAVSLFLSSFISRFYNEPTLASIIPVVSFSSVINGFKSTKIFLYNRDLEFKKIAIIELTSQFFGIMFMVIWAYLDRSVWALVSGNLFSAFIRMILGHLLLKGGRNRIFIDRDCVGDILRFGRWIFISTVFTFLAMQSDRLIFGKMIPMDVLGVYHIGYTLSIIPFTLIQKQASSVFFPLFSRLKGNHKDLNETFAKVRRISLLITGWIFSGFIAGGRAIIDFLYDDRYLSAGWIVQLITIGFWFGTIMNINSNLLLSLGRSRSLAVLNFIKFVSMMILLPLGNHFFNFPGAVCGVVMSEFIRYALSAKLVTSMDFKVIAKDMKYTALLFVSSLGVYYIDHVLSNSDVHIIMRVITVFILITALWSPFLFRSYKEYKAIKQER